jgi:hypothetical protein
MSTDPLPLASQPWFHGTSQEGAEDILRRGIDQSKSSYGYFGQGFYMAEDYALAQNNYADFTDSTERGVVLRVTVKPTARLLDLRQPEDWELWQKSGLAAKLGARDDFADLAVRAGIDGLYDNSFRGLVIYNPEAVERIEVAEAQKPKNLDSARPRGA